MANYLDQLGRSIAITHSPKRIISLVPSQTELLVDLGLRDHIVGITKFCVHPSDLIDEKEVVGGTKQVHLDKIQKLQPDIILCNKEENTEEMVVKLSEIAPVHVSDITFIDDNLELIYQYGVIFNCTNTARSLTNRIKSSLYSFTELVLDTPTYKVAYFIWRNPWMVAGGGTFIDHLLTLCGFENTFSTTKRYPEISLDQLKELDYIFLSSEPFPFKEKHIKELEKYTDAKVILVDGEYFSWYGSRVLKAFDYFTALKKRLL